MKIRLPHSSCQAAAGLPLVVLLFAATAAAAPLPPTHFAATPAELVGYADMDGDGRADTVIVDRATGVIRVAYQNASAEFVWAEGRAGGIYGVTGVTAGRVLSTARDALALTAPTASRINLLELPTGATVASPVGYTPSVVGPTFLAAGQIFGSSALEDLLIGSSLNPAPVHRISLAASAGSGSFGAPTLKQASGHPLASAARVLLKAGAGHQVAYFDIPAATGAVRVLALNEAGSPEKLAVAGIPSDASFLLTPLAGPLAHLITWTRGESSYAARDIVESPPGTFSAGGAYAVAAGFPIGQMVAIPAGAAAKLLIVSQAGDRAVLRATPGGLDEQALTPPPGQSFTGVAAVGFGPFEGFQLLRGSASGGASRHARTYRFNSSNGLYLAGADQALPPVSPVGGAGHVLVYAGEPFVAPDATVIKRLRARDWSSSPTVLGGSATVVAESYGGPVAGLGSPTAVNLGSVPVGDTHVLASQYAPGISIFSLGAATGATVGSVKASPPAGTYAKAVQVSLAGPQNWDLFYRVDAASPWIQYNGPFWLHRDTTLLAAASAAGGQLTPILQAAYRFTAPAGDLSSLNDGIPDYVKIGAGFSPLQLPDRTLEDNPNEQLNYLQILLGATGDSFRRSTSGTALDLFIRPHSHNGIDQSDLPALIPGLTLPSGLSNPGTRVTVRDVSGEPLDSGLVDTFAMFGPEQPAAGLFGIGRGGRSSIAVVGTQPSFALNLEPEYEAETDFVGRELAGLIVLPPSGSANFVHAYGGGSDAVESAAWIAAATTFFQNNPPPRVGMTIDSLGTTLLLAFEQWVTERFVARELLPTSYLPEWGALEMKPQRLTLTPRRPSEPAIPLVTGVTPSGLVLASPEQLASLELFRPVPVGLPMDTGHRLAAAVEAMDDLLRNSSDSRLAALRAVTLDVYRISARWGGKYPGSIPSPVSALRQFFAIGALPAAYREWEELPAEIGTSITALNPADYQAALAGFAMLVGVPEPRPVVTWQLTALPASSGLTCSVFQKAGTGELVSLIDAEGLPFRFPPAFVAPLGSTVEVTGYTDAPDSFCAPQSLEVVRIGYSFEARITAMPMVPSLDLDGNLLPDDWEMLFLGYLGSDPFDSLGGDGYTLLQILVDGKDPLNPKSYTSVPAAPLGVPQVTIEAISDTVFLVSWTFPVPYANSIGFSVQSAAGLGASWSDLPGIVQNLGGGRFEATLTVQGSGQQGFWRIALRLK
jgi:hypothetical protein